MTPDRSKAPEVLPFGLMVMPAETVERLPNGILFHRYRGGDQPVCRLTVQIAGGTAEMGEATAKLLLSQLTEGTAHHDAEEIAEALDYNGARLVTQAQTHFSVIDLSMLSARVGDTLPVLGEILIEPAFPQERLEVSQLKFKNVIQTSRVSPAAMANEGLLALVWGEGNPYAHSMDEAAIDLVTVERLRQCHRRMLAPEKINVYLSGLFDEDTVAHVREFLSSIPRLGEGYGMDIYPANPEPAGTVATVDMPSTLQCGIACGIPTIGRDHPDFAALRFTVMALGGYFGSRLMSNIREDKGLTYGISAAVLCGQDGGHVYIGTLTDRNSADIVIAEIRRELAAMADNPPSGAELERFRTYAMTGLAELLDNPASVMQYYASRNLVGSPDDYFEVQQRVLRSLTPEEIARLSSTYLQPEALRISLAK